MLGVRGGWRGSGTGRKITTRTMMNMRMRMVSGMVMIGDARPAMMMMTILMMVGG